MTVVLDKKPVFIKSYKDLEVYKRAYSVALDIHKVSTNFPKEELYGLTSQVRRASKSICANIAEGFAKQTVSKAEFNRFLAMAVGSANEMDVWISFLYDLQFIHSEKFTAWQEEYNIIVRMLTNLRYKEKPNNPII
jgi:four helix bundle protein